MSKGRMVCSGKEEIEDINFFGMGEQEEVEKDEEKKFGVHGKFGLKIW